MQQSEREGGAEEAEKRVWAVGSEQIDLHQDRGMEGQTESKGGIACYPSICQDWLANIYKHREVRKHLCYAPAPGIGYGP